LSPRERLELSKNQNKKVKKKIDESSGGKGEVKRNFLKEQIEKIQQDEENIRLKIIENLNRRRSLSQQKHKIENNSFENENEKIHSEIQIKRLPTLKVRQPAVVKKSMSNESLFKEAKITRKLSNLDRLADDLDLDMEIKEYTDQADSKKVNAILNNMKAKDSELAMVNKLIKQEETKHQ